MQAEAGKAEEVLEALTDGVCSACKTPMPQSALIDSACAACYSAYEAYEAWLAQAACYSAYEAYEAWLAQEEYDDSARRTYERHQVSRYGARNWQDGY